MFHSLLEQEKIEHGRALVRQTPPGRSSPTRTLLKVNALPGFLIPKAPLLKPRPRGPQVQSQAGVKSRVKGVAAPSICPATLTSQAVGENYKLL